MISPSFPIHKKTTPLLKKSKSTWTINPEKILTLREVKELFKAAEKRKKIGSKCAVRDWLFVNLALMTGMRISEVAGLSCGDVVISASFFPHVIVNGKGNKIRRVQISRRTINTIQEYQEYKISWGEGWDDSEALIRSPITEQHITRWALAQGFRRVLRLARIEKSDRFTPHSLRHSFASALYRSSGNDLQLVAEMLGHSTSAITELYIHLASSEKMIAVDNLYEV